MYSETVGFFSIWQYYNIVLQSRKIHREIWKWDIEDLALIFEVGSQHNTFPCFAGHYVHILEDYTSFYWFKMPTGIICDLEPVQGMSDLR